ncbi:MAG: hypothetical protein OEY66_05700, partial [Gammaproteobacteria bacterium]|nr:hypothetical protein [Gammaproteobacteria bacterium]
MALFQSAGNVLAENKLSVYTKLDGEKITFSDGSGNVNLGCRESYCASVAGKYSHPHNIQQH